MELSPARINDLARRVATDGPEAHASDVARIATLARMTGVAPVAVGVLTDSSAPTVARQRAFGRVAAALDVASRRHSAQLAIAS